VPLRELDSVRFSHKIENSIPHRHPSPVAVTRRPSPVARRPSPVVLARHPSPVPRPPSSVARPPSPRPSPRHPSSVTRRSTPICPFFLDKVQEICWKNLSTTIVVRVGHEFLHETRVFRTKKGIFA
jgi:hypothetical protein